MHPNPEIRIEENSTRLAMAGADVFSTLAIKSVEKRGRFVVAISGGSTPRKMHQLLTKAPYHLIIPWDQTHLFWVDDRHVPETHPASNYGAALKDFLIRVPIPDAQVYPICTRMTPKEDARQYQKMIIDFFDLQKGQFPRFDLIFLGMGADGHTASLFRGAMALEEKTRLALAVKGGIPDVSRVTLTLPVLNHARSVVFLVSGEKKAPTLNAVFNDSGNDLPARRIHLHNGKLTWLADRPAAARL